MEVSDGIEQHPEHLRTSETPYMQFVIRLKTCTFLADRARNDEPVNPTSIFAVHKSVISDAVDILSSYEEQSSHEALAAA